MLPSSALFMVASFPLSFNLDNRVTDTLESSSLQIYSRKHIKLYTQNIGRILCWLNGWFKVDESQKQELWIKSAVAKENCELGYNKKFCAQSLQENYDVNL